MKRYLVIYEHGETSWGPYAPDVPGCVAVGETRGEVEELFKEALVLHLQELRAEGQPIPEPTTEAGQVDIAA